MSDDLKLLDAPDENVAIGGALFTINEEELLSIFKIGSMSKCEHKMVEFVENFLKKEEIEYEKDEMGNIYNFNFKDQPMVCAHMDTVQDEVDAFGAKFAKIYDGEIIRSYGVLGGDDKCGVYICMELLRTFRDLNFCFCVQEEIGMLGSKFVAKNNKEKLKNIAYGLIFDRRGNSDIICNQNDYGTKLFEEDLHHIGKYYKYKPARGLSSDANTFRDYFSCANISCGYYEPHSKNEYVVLEDVENALNFGADIIFNLDRTYAPEVKTYNSGYTRTVYGYNDYDDYYSDYGYFPRKYGKKKKNKEEEKEKKPRTTYTLCDNCNKYGDTIEIKATNTILCKDCAKKIVEELIELAYGEE